ncbi:MAG: glycosyltransferase family 4 protein, partial [Fastidiosipilaceae bacterium]
TLLVVGKGDQTTARDLAGPALDWIVFTGFVDDITLKKCYALCDVYVCPSRLEGFGLTLVEAMRCGKPIIASNAGAIREVLGSYDSGILIDPDNSIQLSKNLLRFIQSRNEYNQQGKGIVKEYLDWKKCAEQTASLYYLISSSHEFA